MNDRLKSLLDHLASLLDPNRQREIENLYTRALTWESVARLPLVLTFPLPSDFPFQLYPHGETFDDPEKMLYNELVHAFGASIACRDRIADDLPWTIRANFGTVVMATMFGGRVERRGNDPPWVRPFETLETFRAILDLDPLDFRRGWCPRVEERYQFYRDVLAVYPPLQQSMRIVLPDLQGPLDTLELLRGSAVYPEFYTAPELLARTMERLATAQVGFARRLAKYTTDGPAGFAHQHGVMIRGGILIRADSAILISPELYRDQVAPHDEFVLREMGGGGVHACGRMQQVAPEFLRLPSLQCIDLGQPERNDIDRLYAMARERRIALIRLRVEESQLVSGEVMRRFPTGATLVHEAESLDQAQRIWDAYRRATER
jgi:hypothetical protein